MIRDFKRHKILNTYNEVYKFLEEQDEAKEFTLLKKKQKEIATTIYSNYFSDKDKDYQQETHQ